MTSYTDITADTDLFLNTFGERLKFVRVFVAHMDSAEEFAEKIGVPGVTYRTWENGTSRQPRNIVEIARRVSELFPRVGVMWLLDGPGCHISSYVAPGPPSSQIVDLAALEYADVM